MTRIVISRVNFEINFNILNLLVDIVVIKR